MLDMSWGEVMLIGGVALIVIGPKDLPKALRTVGQITTKLRRMAGEFQSQFNEAIREAELDDVRKEVDGLKNTVSRATGGFNPVQTIRDELKGAVDARSPKPDGESLAAATAQLKAAEAGTTAGQGGSYDVPLPDPVIAPPISASASVETAHTALPEPAAPQPGSAPPKPLDPAPSH